MKISVIDQGIVLVEDDTLIQNSGRRYTIEFLFDESWDGFSKTAVLSTSGVTAEIPLTENQCVIPLECLAHGGVPLCVSVRGVKGDERKETSWCVTSTILYKAKVDVGRFPSGMANGIHDGIVVALPFANWNDKAQTVQNDFFMANSGYWYFVYGSDANIRMDNISIDGQAVFRCDSVPTGDVTVNILRVEVEQ